MAKRKAKVTPGHGNYGGKRARGGRLVRGIDYV
jgi:hypothetical protein